MTELENLLADHLPWDWRRIIKKHLPDPASRDVIIQLAGRHTDPTDLIDLLRANANDASLVCECLANIPREAQAEARWTHEVLVDLACSSQVSCKQWFEMCLKVRAWRLIPGLVAVLDRDGDFGEVNDRLTFSYDRVGKTEQYEIPRSGAIPLSAMGACARLGVAKASRDLIEVANANLFPVCAWLAIDFFGRMDDKRARGAILRWAKSPEWLVGEYAFTKLLHLADPRVVDIAIKYLLGDHDQHSAQALVELAIVCESYSGRDQRYSDIYHHTFHHSDVLMGQLTDRRDEIIKAVVHALQTSSGIGYVLLAGFRILREVGGESGLIVARDLSTSDAFKDIKSYICEPWELAAELEID